jgi:hypothetical protein
MKFDWLDRFLMYTGLGDPGAGGGKEETPKPSPSTSPTKPIVQVICRKIVNPIVGGGDE